MIRTICVLCVALLSGCSAKNQAPDDLQWHESSFYVAKVWISDERGTYATFENWHTPFGIFKVPFSERIFVQPDSCVPGALVCARDNSHVEINGLTINGVPADTQGKP